MKMKKIYIIPETSAYSVNIQNQLMQTSPLHENNDSTVGQNNLDGAGEADGSANLGKDFYEGDWED